jgi:hypothetical protein
LLTRLTQPAGWAREEGVSCASWDWRSEYGPESIRLGRQWVALEVSLFFSSLARQMSWQSRFFLTLFPAIVLCTPATRSYLINYARSLIYTTAMGYPMLTAIQTVYDYLESGQADGLLANLMSLMQETHTLLLSVCQKHSPPPQLFRINASPPESPIIPLFSAQSRSLARHCQQRGYMVRPIVAPTVPKGTDRVRLCLHAANTVSEVRGLCTAIEEWLEQQNTKDLSPRADGVQRPSVDSLTSLPVAEPSKL